MAIAGDCGGEREEDAIVPRGQCLAHEVEKAGAATGRIERISAEREDRFVAFDADAGVGSEEFQTRLAEIDGDGIPPAEFVPDGLGSGTRGECSGRDDFVRPIQGSRGLRRVTAGEQ